MKISISLIVIGLTFGVACTQNSEMTQDSTLNHLILRKNMETVSIGNGEQIWTEGSILAIVDYIIIS